MAPIAIARVLSFLIKKRGSKVVNRELDRAFIEVLSFRVVDQSLFLKSTRCLCATEVAQGVPGTSKMSRPHGVAENVSRHLGNSEPNAGAVGIITVAAEVDREIEGISSRHRNRMAE